MKPAQRLPAWGYVRVSTTEQATEGLSLGVQQQKIDAYAALHNLELEEIIVDPGESAKDLNRPGMKRLLLHIRSGAVGAVVVYKLDRLTRSPRDLYMLVDDEFNPRGIELVSITEQIDTRTPGGRAMLGVMGIFSQMERELIGERTRAALDAKRERGERLGVAPYGFRIPFAGAPKLEAEPVELIVVRRVLGWRRSGRSYGWIARTLNAEGVPSKRGGEWSDVTIRDIWLRRKRYAPFLSAKKVEPVPSGAAA